MMTFVLLYQLVLCLSFIQEDLFLQKVIIDDPLLLVPGGGAVVGVGRPRPRPRRVPPHSVTGAGPGHEASPV